VRRPYSYFHPIAVRARTGERTIAAHEHGDGDEIIQKSCNKERGSKWVKNGRKSYLLTITWVMNSISMIHDPSDDLNWGFCFG